MVLPESLKARSFAIELDFVPQTESPVFPPSGRHAVLTGYEEVAQYQIFDLWCWNAVGCSIVSYHRRDLAGRKETIQCENARRLFGTRSCELSIGNVSLDGWSHIMKDFDRFGQKWQPARRSSSEGNQTGLPNRVTDAIPNLQSTWLHHPQGPTRQDLDTVVRSIVDDGPVAMYVTSGGAAHVIALYGCTEDRPGWPTFFHADPINGFGMITLAEALAFRPGWKWTYSMITKATPVLT